jgi:hypothetical protein
MKIPVIEKIAGTTIRPTWVSSGSNPSYITSLLYDKDENVIDTQFAINSGDWGWLALHQLPSSPNAWYVNRWFAVIDANTYVNVQFIKAVWPTVE